jgi:hypothetical protein
MRIVERFSKKIECFDAAVKGCISRMFIQAYTDVRRVHSQIRNMNKIHIEVVKVHRRTSEIQNPPSFVFKVAEDMCIRQYPET